MDNTTTTTTPDNDYLWDTSKPKYHRTRVAQRVVRRIVHAFRVRQMELMRDPMNDCVDSDVLADVFALQERRLRDRVAHVLAQLNVNPNSLHAMVTDSFRIETMWMPIAIQPEGLPSWEVLDALNALTD